MKYKTILTNDFTLRSFYVTDTTVFGYASSHGKTTVLVCVGGKHLSNPIPRKYRNKMRNTFYEAQSAVYSVLRHLDRRTTYYVQSGTDCDGVHSSGRFKCSNAVEAHNQIEGMYEWADGPLSVVEVTKREYDEYESTYRDYGMEAYEDGHPHCRHG